MHAPLRLTRGTKLGTSTAEYYDAWARVARVYYVDRSPPTAGRCARRTRRRDDEASGRIGAGGRTRCAAGAVDAGPCQAGCALRRNLPDHRLLPFELHQQRTAADTRFDAI